MRPKGDAALNETKARVPAIVSTRRSGTSCAKPGRTSTAEAIDMHTRPRNARVSTAVSIDPASAALTQADPSVGSS